MKWLVSLFAVAIALVSRTCFAYVYTPPPGSPGFYHGNSTAAVTFDNLSVFIDNKRVFIFSGEFHPWRIPAGKAAWRDVLQKMKAAGFNAVSVYLHWGLSEGRQGSLDFDFYRSHTDFYDVAKEVGVLVVVRPGPYINAETLGGGLPPWLSNNPVKARTNATAYLEAWTPYIAATAQFAAPYQYPDGPIIAIQVENEFFPQSDPLRANHMVQLEDALRKNGIDKIPLVANDVGINGNWVNGTGNVDIYGWDNYPNGFLCASPESWSEVNPNQNNQHLTVDPAEVWITMEFQGGSFDPWGGSGYEKCFDLINEQFANVFYKNNYAGGVKWQSFYMTFGGTNWGNLAEPTVYTSYDYGAPIKEDRSLTPKYDEIKLQAQFLHASQDFTSASVIFTGANRTTNPLVWSTEMRGLSATNFYIVRQTSNRNTATLTFKMPITSRNKTVVIPQLGGEIALAGRESKIIVSDYIFGRSILDYSTAEIMTWTTIDNIDYLVLYALKGQTLEAVLRNPSSARIIVTGSTSVRASTSNQVVQIAGSPDGITAIRFGATTVLVVDKLTATSFWNVKLLGRGDLFDVAPNVPSVLVQGPYLVRNASIDGSVLNLFGDLNQSTTVQFVAPASVKALAWNGKHVRVTRSDIGLLSGKIPFTLNEADVVLPDLSKVSWNCLDSLPEIQEGFDDSSFVVASKTNTSRPLQPLGGKFMLYSDEYGFHQGNVIYRGHFTGEADSISLSVQGGFNFGYSLWLNGVFLGSSQGTNQYTTMIDLTNVTWTFPEGSVKPGDNVLTLVFDQTGMEEDFDGDESFKTPRGIRGYKLNGVSEISWKLAGNFGGEDFPDAVRGPFNEGGLFVERIGAHLPGFDTSGWLSGASCDPFIGISQAGITAYHTTFKLNMPKASDIPLALKFVLDPVSSYRAIIFINGWQFGRFNSRDGPQDTFPLPQGVLNHNGENTLLVTLWSLDAHGAHMKQLDLIKTRLIQSSREDPGFVTSPTFQEVRIKTALD